MADSIDYVVNEPEFKLTEKDKADLKEIFDWEDASKKSNYLLGVAPKDQPYE
jgi:hypothetical protein